MKLPKEEKNRRWWEKRGKIEKCSAKFSRHNFQRNSSWVFFNTGTWPSLARLHLQTHQFEPPTPNWQRKWAKHKPKWQTVSAVHTTDNNLIVLKYYFHLSFYSCSSLYAPLSSHIFFCCSSRRRSAIDHRRLFVYNISSPFPSIILLCESFIHFRQLFGFYEFLREHIACPWILDSAKFSLHSDSLCSRLSWSLYFVHCSRHCHRRHSSSSLTLLLHLPSDNIKNIIEHKNVRSKKSFYVNNCTQTDITIAAGRCVCWCEICVHRVQCGNANDDDDALRPRRIKLNYI